jgi:hypothetical protein
MPKASDLNPYLRPEDIENADILTIVDKPKFIDAETSVLGKPYFEILVQIIKTVKIKPWRPNKTAMNSIANGCVSFFNKEARKGFGDETAS